MHVFSDEYIEPLSYSLVTSEDTAILLSNSSGAVRVYAPDGSLLGEMTYGETKEGWSYMRDVSGAWVWTTSPTPTQVNVLTLPTPHKQSLSRQVAQKRQKLP